MIANALTILLPAAVIAFVYWLGYRQGVWLGRRHVRERERRLHWQLGEALSRWSPWDRDPSEWRARLEEEYEERSAP